MNLNPLRAARMEYLKVCVGSKKFGGRSANKRSYCVSFCLLFPLGRLFVCLFPSHSLSSIFYAFSPLYIVVTQIRGHIASFPPPYPLRFVPCICCGRFLFRLQTDFLLLQVSFCPVKREIRAACYPNESD